MELILFIILHSISIHKKYFNSLIFIVPAFKILSLRYISKGDYLVVFCVTNQDLEQKSIVVEVS